MISSIWNISLFSSFLILIVTAFREIFRKFPKSYSYILWLPVLFRLLCPIVWESSYSIFQKEIWRGYQEKVNEKEQLCGRENEMKLADNANAELGERNSGEEILPDNPNFLSAAGSTPLWEMVSGEVNILEILKAIYLLGMCFVATGYLQQYLTLRRKLSTAVRQEGNIWLCEQIETPFVLGIFRPVIYLPFSMEEKQRHFVLAHERAHIRYGDHIVRTLGLLARCIHWWNPLVWFSVSLMYRDMEMYCDERVLQGESLERKKEYAEVLLHFAAKKVGCGISLPFGETNTEKRIRNVFLKKYRNIFLFKLSAVIVIVAMGFLLTTPVSNGAEKLQVIFQYKMDYWNVFDLKEGSMKNREVLEDTCLRYMEEIEELLGFDYWWKRVNSDADTLVINLAICEGKTWARLPYPGLPKEVETMIQLNASTISNPDWDGGLASMITGIMIGDSFSPLLANGLCGYVQKQIGTDFVKELGLNSQEIYEMCVNGSWERYGLSQANYNALYETYFVEYLIETYGTEQVMKLVLEGVSEESWEQILGKSFKELQQDWFKGGQQK